ncbi:hypothetical protein [Niabella beijingensis]|uniref:hypothetical protein n=1 Tax=Niabella beijingensis TaxID=2872700 RepID=UPI001CBEC3F9|nr:hypothetical protein [Niabella beijingensis]MBZ4190685.1 hypothetical protein [Niabella beijingensis]
MKKICILILLLAAVSGAKAQRVESIHLNLYTDSLKKGTHNYINIDGKMSDGSWKPLTNKELKFTSDYGKFDGNSLVLPDEPTVKKVVVTATLKDNPKMVQQATIWIKQQPDPPLPAADADAGRNRRGRR